MTVGDPGPYMNEDGDIWVPRTVPWREARAVARRAVQEYGFVLLYIGKTDATLYGFSRDCHCDWQCDLVDEEREGYDSALADACIVPAWHFRQDEP